MENDAMVLNVEKVTFHYNVFKKMRVYAVAISADNIGKVLLTEPPSSAVMHHRPRIGKPAVWDFGFDGYPIYQRTGGLAELVVFHLMIIRQKEAARRAGEIIKRVAGSEAVSGLVSSAKERLHTTGVGGLAAPVALGALLPIAELVGDILESTPDKVIQTISGSMFFDEQRKAESNFEDQVKSPDSNMTTDLEFSLYDAASDEDTTATIASDASSLEANGLLLDI